MRCRAVEENGITERERHDGVLPVDGVVQRDGPLQVGQERRRHRTREGQDIRLRRRLGRALGPHDGASEVGIGSVLLAEALQLLLGDARQPLLADDEPLVVERVEDARRGEPYLDAGGGDQRLDGLREDDGDRLVCVRRMRASGNLSPVNFEWPDIQGEHRWQDAVDQPLGLEPLLTIGDRGVLAQVQPRQR